MSAKRNIFSPQGQDGSSRREPEDFEDMYTGHPGEQPFFAQEKTKEPVTPPEQTTESGRHAARGRAAYAAKETPIPDPLDQMPSFEPRQRSGGGLFGGQDPFQTQAQEQHRGEAFQTTPDSGDLLSIIPLDALVRECNERVCPACPTKKDADDARLRALAELDNAKKRMEREHAEQARFAAEAVLSDILPSLDNLDLALQHASASEACRDFVTGVRMTRKLLLDALAGHGLAQVGECGEEFNPAVHEAVGMLADKNVADGHICALLACGYKLNDRLLRPAKVMVCKNSA